MKLRRFISMMLIVTMLTVFAGCGNKDDRTQAARTLNLDGPITVNVWFNNSDYEPYLEFVAKQFKQANELVTINPVYVEADSYINYIYDESVRNDNACDLYFLTSEEIEKAYLMGLMSENDMYPQVYNEDVFGKAAMTACSYNGKLYGYPLTADNGYFMYYNKNYFSDSDVATLDGMLDIAGANGKYLTMDWSSGWYLYSFFGNTGLDFGVNDDGVTNHCNWNAIITDIKGVDIAQAMLDIAAKPGFKNCVQDDFIAGVQDGSIIAGVSGCWNAAKIKELWGDDYGAVKLPTYTCAGQQIQMSSFKGYKYMAVNAYTKYPEWANKLAQWFTNEDNQKLRFEMKNAGPANKAAAADDAVKKVPAIMAVMDQAQYGKLQRVGNSYWDAATEFGEKMAAGNPDNTDLQEIMDNLVAGITQSVAE
mgnify:CR=1 FL=1